MSLRKLNALRDPRLCFIIIIRFMISVRIDIITVIVIDAMESMAEHGFSLSTFDFCISGSRTHYFHEY